MLGGSSSIVSSLAGRKGLGRQRASVKKGKEICSVENGEQPVTYHISKQKHGVEQSLLSGDQGRSHGIDKDKYLF